MKRLLPLLLLSAHLTQAQTKPVSDLSHYSRTQLQACYQSLKLCGAEDDYAITDELESRLSTLPTPILVRCFSNWRICGVMDSTVTGWPLSDELASRGRVDQILARYGNATKWNMRGGLEHVAYHSNSPQAQAFMRRVFTRRLDDGEDLYWPAKYLSKHCDPAALHYLSHHAFSISSLELASSTELFGKCHYRPAIPFLVDALQAASLNLVGAAETSLRALYPNAPQFSSLEDEQHWFCRAAHRNRYKADCED